MNNEPRRDEITIWHRLESWLSWLPWYRRRARQGDLERELRDHLDLEADAQRAAGLSPKEAAHAAHRILGNTLKIEEDVRAAWGFQWLEALGQDVRFSLRQFRRNPAFSIVTVLTLALGIGINTTIFTIVNGFLLRPLPVHDASQIVAIAVREKDVPVGSRGFSNPEFADIRTQLASTVDVFANAIDSSEMTIDGGTDFCAVSLVSANFFTALGITPTSGRTILPNEAEGPNAETPVVLSYAYWQRRFRGTPAIGKHVLVERKLATVVGIAPKDFHGMFSIFPTDAYVPMSIMATEDSHFATDRDYRRLLVFGRLRGTVKVSQAQSEIDVVSARLAQQYPRTDAMFSFRVIPERYARPQPYANNYFLMAGALFLGLAAFVFLLACINVENLLLTKTLARQREIGIRASLGAGRGRLIRQLTTENLVLSALGGVAGAFLGLIANRFVGSIGFQGFPLRFDVTFDWRVFSYVSLSAAVAGLVVSFFPAFRAFSSEPNAVLRGHPISSAVFGNTFRGRNLLVVGQIAGSMALLIVAALFAQSLRQARNLDLGFDPQQVLIVTLDPTAFGYGHTRTVDFYREIESRVSILPGVQSVSFAANVPMGAFPCKADVYIENLPLDRGQNPPHVFCNSVSGSYFATLRIALLRGRTFDFADNEHGVPVAIINQKMAQQFWPNQDPIGQRFSLASQNGPWVEVVGVSANGKYLTVMEDPTSSFYLPLSQDFSAKQALLVRTIGTPESLAGPIGREIETFAPGVPPLNVETMQHLLDGAFGFFTIQLAASLAGVMGGVGLALAIVGVYGVVSFALAQRTREFGIRMALGAVPRDVFVLVLRQGFALGISGVLVGFIVTRVLSKMVQHLLYGVTSTDPLTYAGIAVLLTLLVLLACIVPARRAIRVDPVVALRHE